MGDADDILSSPSWHRVAGLKPRIRAHVKFHRHGFRDQIWFVLEDRAAGRFFRFSPAAHELINRMDGTSTVENIWQAFAAKPGNETANRSDVISLLAQLHRANVLHGDTSPDIGELVERTERTQRKKEMMKFLNPLAIKVPLFDPERFVAVTFPLVRPLYSVFGLILILGLIGYAALQASMHWQELTNNFFDRLLTVQNFVLILLAYPLIKLVHEFGHAYAVKRWGGEVHELGVMMLVFMPVPYVDASAAAAFPSKWARALVGSAGILVELALAAIALLIWLQIEPGLPRAFLFNVMVIGGVSTLLFNGNPLLRFDGYYVLSDLIEIPNLGQRANRYIRYLVMGRLFGAENVKSPVAAPGEAFWFALYAPAAWIYRLFVMAAIIFFVAGKAFFIGIALAFWAVGLMYVLPAFKGVKALLFSPDLRGHRARALGVTGGTLGAIVAVLCLVPVPHTTVATGVVNPGSDAQIVALTDGFVADVGSAANRRERDPVVVLRDPLLDAREASLMADLAVIESRQWSAVINEPAEARILRDRQAHARADLNAALERRENLAVLATAPGKIVVPGHDDLPGRFIHKGQLIGYAMDPERYVIDVVLPEARVDLLGRTEAIHIRRASEPSLMVRAALLQQTPSAIDVLPNPALSTTAGGPIVTDPNDPAALATVSPTFKVQLGPEVPLSGSFIGERVFVRFDHGSESLARQAYRSLRQLFLARFNV